jgi:hypothetical protein
MNDLIVLAGFGSLLADLPIVIARWTNQQSP